MTEVASVATTEPMTMPISAYVRLLAIVAATTDSGAIASSETIHAIAYFADVLAPVYGLDVLYPQVLKRSRVAAVPEMQHHIDRLVGLGLLAISDVEYSLDGGAVRLHANYSLNLPLAEPVLHVMNRRARSRAEVEYVRELTLALLGLGTEALWTAAEADATYGDPNVDTGTIVEVRPSRPNQISRAVQAARAFGTLASGTTLAPSEMINLYVRHLYNILVQQELS